MAGNALPLLLIAGAAVVLGSKKKKKKKTVLADAGTTTTTPGATTTTPGTLPTPGTTKPGPGTTTPRPTPSPYGGGTTTTVPKPVPKPTTSKIPSGDPPNDAGAGKWGNYDHAFWDSAAKIKEIFVQLGYPVPDRPTMNDPGKDGKLGGNDDIKNASVELFQDQYNAVSRAKIWSGMGGLGSDGMVGPKTLNGLKFVIDHLNGKKWQSDIVQQAALKGEKA